jgi:2-succinyl-5-enolpyruvyl-6-hydroxy-3-cyclohexene-1-carboxylate synthase
MPEVHPANLPTLWTAHVVNELFRCGVRYAVISPGSRSTPLTMAFAAHPGIEKIVVLDERSAAFRALGIARETGVPAALVCTSGTAVSNYLPALTEASAAGVPMLALTADRPPNQRLIGANQTIQQNGIFSTVSVFSADCGEPVDHPVDFRRVEILAGQAFHQARQFGGPAHLNFPFRKPLEPQATFFQGLEGWYAENLDQRRDPVFQQEHTSTGTLPDWFSEMLQKAKRPVVIAGPAHGHTSAEALITFFQNNGVPVLAEAGSGIPVRPDKPTTISGFNAYLRIPSLRSELAPDLIIRLGTMPTGKGMELYLNNFRNVPHILISGPGELSNPSLAYIKRISVAAGAALAPPSGAILGPEPTWSARWIGLSEAFSQARKVYIDKKSSTNDPTLTDGDVHHITAKYLGTDHRLMISNSFPARDADTFAMPEIGAIRTHMNRGASGIDGISSTAAGIARACRKPTWLLTGDLAFLHDLSGLLNLVREPISLTIIVINNAGGTIFRMLPVYTPSDWYSTYFETPQQVDLEKISAGLGLHFHRVQSRHHLEQVLAAPFDSGVRIVECQTDAGASMTERHQINHMITG